MKHAVFVFCTDLNKDPVASHVLSALANEVQLIDTELEIDGCAVQKTSTPEGNRLSVVRTHEVASHDYARYAPLLNAHFSDADLIGLVNWHQGAKAPEKIFTVQTTGDMGSGSFSPVDPALVRSLLLAIEDKRQSVGLGDFHTLIEATHWSGVQYGSSGKEVLDIAASVVDIEIGSYPDDWANPIAAKVLARALPHVFDRANQPLRSLLCFGGVHFEPGFCQPVFAETDGAPFATSHILPNQWLVSEGYDQPDRIKALHACAASVTGGVDAIVFHDKLKASYKAMARQLAEDLGVPAVSHKKLRNPTTLTF
ncbi:D-aminoacyl-tRNA deacylase [Shimia thalassica]|uniref:D-aminoacyl-tRNA deacylase n=1 Tax=Shimia thalassica TaxID=1715693 RepID=A0A0P1IFQ7_9RHOB|nr:D-aminoacyl-tRNA deacylase [Shimia thalassica]CUK10539.1 D-aminoacyl-tRNA deacylase [Shimia thalassica]